MTGQFRYVDGEAIEGQEIELTDAEEVRYYFCALSKCRIKLHRQSPSTFNHCILIDCTIETAIHPAMDSRFVGSFIAASPTTWSVQGNDDDR